ncbi:hypothetical protein Tco_1366386, partial [Tanacetum coccineum]
GANGLTSPRVNGYLVKAHQTHSYSCGGLHVAASEFMKVAAFGVHAVKEYEIGFKILLFNPLAYVVPTSRGKVPTGRVKVPTCRVKVPAGRYVVPTGKENVIVSNGRSKAILAGRTILVLVVLCLLRVDSIVS